MEKLWTCLKAGRIDMIASDHSPCPASMKATDDLFEAWGGISGAQSSLELMLDEGFAKRGVPLPQLSRLLSYEPARRFGLHPRKGEISPGADADLVLVRLHAPYRLEAEQLLYRHKISPYVGRSFSCQVVSTYSRGRLVYERGSGVRSLPSGEWIGTSPSGAKAGNTAL